MLHNCVASKRKLSCEFSTYIGIYSKENVVLVACLHSLCTREKRHLEFNNLCVYKEVIHCPLQWSKLYKEQETASRVMEYPFDTFPRFPYSGVVERQNIQARNHFMSTRANDQNSHQFLGPVERPPLITVGSFLCAIQEDWIAMTFSWANPGHYQILARTNGCFLVSQIKKQAAWEMIVLRCVFSKRINIANELKNVQTDANKITWIVYSSTWALFYTPVCTNTN